MSRQFFYPRDFGARRRREGKDLLSLEITINRAIGTANIHIGETAKKKGYFLLSGMSSCM